jgi:hypothetical protein
MLMKLYTPTHTGVNKIMGTVGNRGLEFVYVGYTQITSADNTECSSSVCLHCSARVSALMVVLSESPCERIGKWKTCLILKENRSLVCV